MDEDMDGVKLAKYCEAHLLHQHANEDSSQKHSGEKEGEGGGTMLLGQITLRNKASSLLLEILHSHKHITGSEKSYFFFPNFV